MKESSINFGGSNSHEKKVRVSCLSDYLLLLLGGGFLILWMSVQKDTGDISN